MRNLMNRIVLTSVCLATSGAASAGTIEETFECGEAFFDSHTPFFEPDDQILSRQRFPSQNPNQVLSFRIDIEFIERDALGLPAPDPLGWASDLGMVVEFDGVRYGFGGSRGHLGAIAGGYTLGEALGSVDYFEIWDFDGPVSDASGFYTHEFDLPIPSGKGTELRVFLTDTWNGNAEYRRATITTTKTPTPGTVALFGLAGLASLRRRR